MRSKCRECPHFGESLKGVAELEVRGKKQDYHPCHNDTEMMCVGWTESPGTWVEIKDGKVSLDMLQG